MEAYLHSLMSSGRVTEPSIGISFYGVDIFIKIRYRFTWYT
jgi:hypothetical protein